MEMFGKSFAVSLLLAMCSTAVQAKVIVLNKSDFEIKVLVKWATGDAFHHVKDWEAFPNVQKPKPVDNNRKLKDEVPGLQPFVNENDQRNDPRNYTKSDGSYVKDNVYVWAKLPDKGWQEVKHLSGRFLGGAVKPVIVTVTSRPDHRPEHEGDVEFDVSISAGE
jgi:hypothetical protein